MARPSKEHILREIRRLAGENGGRPLGVRNFRAATGVQHKDWEGRYWARWGDAVREAGFAPAEWNKKRHDDDSLLRILAGLTREYGHIPTSAELALRRRTDATLPAVDSYRRRFGSRSALTERLQAFADADPEFADVAAVVAATSPASPRRQARAPKSDRVVTGAVYMVRMGEFHKIGKSNDPGRRLYELGLHLPEKHDVVHIIETDDPSGIEAYWHRRFAAQRANGEWFRLAPGDVAAFARRSYM